jgi:hypothetical protein
MSGEQIAVRGYAGSIWRPLKAREATVSAGAQSHHVNLPSNRLRCGGRERDAAELLVVWSIV